MTENTIIAVPKDEADGAGSITYWRLNGALELNVLRDAWAESALKDDWLPKDPTLQRALRRAMDTQTSKHRFVRTVPKQAGGGLALVDEKVKDAASPLDFAIVARARIVDGQPEVKALETAVQQKIESYWRIYQYEIDAPAAGGWLSTRVLPALNAVSLRSGGGIYYVPPQSMGAWEKVVEVTHEVSEHRVFQIPAMTSADAVDAVLDAVSEEARAIMDAVAQDLKTLDALGKRALKTRIRRCEEVRAKVESYESLLGVQMETLTARSKELGRTYTVALLGADA